MDIIRIISIAIVMMVPILVGAAICWEVLPSWFTILCWIAFMVWLYKKIITGTLIPDLKCFISKIKMQLHNQISEETAEKQ